MVNLVYYAINPESRARYEIHFQNDIHALILNGQIIAEDMNPEILKDMLPELRWVNNETTTD